MTKKEVWILAGVAIGVVVVGYLATKREINATITAGDATVTYQTSVGAQGSVGASEDSHAKMLRLIEQSSQAIRDDAVDVSAVQ